MGERPDRARVEVAAGLQEPDESKDSPVTLADMSSWMKSNSGQGLRRGDVHALRTAGGRPGEAAEGESGVDKQQLAEIIRQLEGQGKDTTLLAELKEYFDDFDTNHDGRVGRGEVDPFLSYRVAQDLKFAAFYTELPWQKAASQAQAVLAAGIGGEYAARFAVDSYAKLNDWQKANPAASLDMWQYSVGALFAGKTLRDRLDGGLDSQQMKDLRTFLQDYGHDKLYGRAPYFQNAIPPLLGQAIDLELQSPGTVDKNGDGRVDCREVLAWGAKEKFHVDFERLDQRGCEALGIAIADLVPNPEWPFFEDLGWSKPGAFESADKDGDKILNRNEMNRYFKSEVWNKFDFRIDCFQHHAKPDSVSLADVHWSYESADCFALADVGGRESAQLVADTFKGIERNWSQYATDSGGTVQGEIKVEQYSSALKTELSAALLKRLTEGVTYENLKDYADVSDGLRSHFNISDPKYDKLVAAVKAAADRPQQYDTNGDGIISAEELWQTPRGG